MKILVHSNTQPNRERRALHTILPLSSLPILLFLVRRDIGSRHFVVDLPAEEAAPSLFVLYMTAVYRLDQPSYV